MSVFIFSIFFTSFHETDFLFLSIFSYVYLIPVFEMSVFILSSFLTSIAVIFIFYFLSICLYRGHFVPHTQTTYRTTIFPVIYIFIFHTIILQTNNFIFSYCLFDIISNSLKKLQIMMIINVKNKTFKLKNIYV